MWRGPHEALKRFRMLTSACHESPPPDRSRSPRGGERGVVAAFIVAEAIGRSIATGNGREREAGRR